MKPEDLAFAFLIATVLLFFINPNVSSLFASLVIFLGFYIVYYGPYEMKPATERMGFALISLGVLLFLVILMLGPRVVASLLGISHPDPLTYAMINFIPTALILSGLYMVIDATMRKKIKGA